MDKVREVIKKLVENGKLKAQFSEEALEKALLEQGCSKEEIEDFLSEFAGFPLDDDNLAAITGGIKGQERPRSHTGTIESLV